MQATTNPAESGHQTVRDFQSPKRTPGVAAFFEDLDFVPHLGVQTDGDNRIVTLGKNQGNGKRSFLKEALEYAETNQAQLPDLLKDHILKATMTAASSSASQSEGSSSYAIPSLMLDQFDQTYERSYSPYLPRIPEIPPDYVERTSIKEKVVAFLDNSDRGFFLLYGPPGTGKTVLMSGLSRELESIVGNGAVIPFVNPVSEPFSVLTCLRRLFSSLARAAGVTSTQPFADVDVLAEEFAGLLKTFASARIQQEDSASQQDTEDDTATRSPGRLVFLIDALDQADKPSLLLNLIPKDLPKGVFFLFSSRPPGLLKGFFSSLPGAAEPFEIRGDDPESRSDACRFLQAKLPEWPTSTLQQLAVEANANFLFLDLFVDFVRRESIPPTQALAKGTRIRSS